MKPMLVVLVGLCFLCGCSAIVMSEKNAVIVMAKEVEKHKGAKGITDVFTYEGKIYVYVTFHWDIEREPLDWYNIEAKWYNGDKLISISHQRAYFDRTPHYVWLSTRGTNMGQGECRVEIYADGHYVGNKSFAVINESI